MERGPLRNAMIRGGVYYTRYSSNVEAAQSVRRYSGVR